MILNNMIWRQETAHQYTNNNNWTRDSIKHKNKSYHYTKYTNISVSLEIKFALMLIKT